VTLEPLEAAVLEKLFDGDHPNLIGLRAQLAGLVVTEREYSGGFFTTLAVNAAARPISVSSLRFGDVEATIAGLQHGAGFVVFVDGVMLTMLEGYCYGEPWLEEIRELSLRYWDPDRTDLFSSVAGLAASRRSGGGP